MRTWYSQNNYSRLLFCYVWNEFSLGNGTDTEEAYESKAECLWGSETGLIPAPYSLEPSGTGSDSSATTSGDDSEAQQTFRSFTVKK